MAGSGVKVMARNQKARHEYFIEESFEAGIELVGTEVTVRGVKVTPRDVVVSDFVVRAHEGVPALDGIVESDGSLRLTDGSGVRRVVLPEPVREMTGARVWIAQRNGRTTGYGLIVRR